MSNIRYKVCDVSSPGLLMSLIYTVEVRLFTVRMVVRAPMCVFARLLPLGGEGRLLGDGCHSSQPDRAAGSERSCSADLVICRNAESPPRVYQQMCDGIRRVPGKICINLGSLTFLTGAPIVAHCFSIIGNG